MRLRSSLLLASLLLSACMAANPPAKPETGSGAGASSSSKESLKLHSIKLTSPTGKVLSLRVEQAKTPAEREKGLMGRQSLPFSDGMLFTFSKSEVLNFWMKDTLIPLDVYFFATNGDFVSMSTMPPCTTAKCATYSSSGPALFALEVPAGAAAKEKIGPGWRLTER